MTNTTKLKIYGALAHVKQSMDKASIAVASVGSAALGMAFGASAETSTTPTIDLSKVDFSGLTAAITGVVPQILPVAVTICGIRKAISFVMSTIRGC